MKQLNWFQNGMEAGSDESLEATFKILSMDIQDILVRSEASEIEKMKPWEYEQYESEIDKARAEGRLDLSS